MHHSKIDPFLQQLPKTGGAPLAMVFAEDDVAVAATVAHLLGLGFAQVALFAPPELALNDLPEHAALHRIDWQTCREFALVTAVNKVIAAAPGIWMHYCYNSEFLFYPFCETRSIRDLVSFQTEERRDAILTYVIDLYAGDLTLHPRGVSPPEAAYFDGSGYYALARPDPLNSNHPKERQLDFFGGLRWRFEEHVPENHRRIDRIGLFRAERGLRLLDEHRFNHEEYNTYSCPWHNNITAAICSFRTAKALRSNPGSRQAIRSLLWRDSLRFDWHSQQLMDLGLMEPGQWF